LRFIPIREAPLYGRGASHVHRRPGRVVLRSRSGEGESRSPIRLMEPGRRVHLIESNRIARDAPFGGRVKTSSSGSNISLFEPGFKSRPILWFRKWRSTPSDTESPSSPHLCCLLVAFLDVLPRTPASAPRRRPGTLWVVPLNATGMIPRSTGWSVKSGMCRCRHCRLDAVLRWNAFA